MLQPCRKRLVGARCRSRLAGLAGALICLLLFATGVCRAEDAKREVTVATTRLEKVLSSLGLPEDEAKQQAKALHEIRDALELGYFYLGLFELQRSWAELMAHDYARSRAGIEKRGVRAFEDEWQRLGLELNEKEKLLDSRPQVRSSAAVLALSEVSRNQARPYYQSGRLYGINASLGAGLFYMGLAPANLDFALFCRRLSPLQTRPEMKLRPLSAELNELESETLRAYAQPGAASQKEPQFNRLNTTLKMASELNKDGMYEGALLKYLEASLYLGLIDARPAGPAELPRLKTANESFRLRLAEGEADHSIGLMYWELAQGTLERAGKPGGGDLKLAAVILDRVLPGYFKYVTEVV